MKASDLIGRPVLDSTGRRLGIVTDLRCVQDGPVRGSMAAPRVHHVVISSRRTGSMLGYDRRDQQGPWLIRLIVRWLHRNLLIVPWESIQLSDDGGIRTVLLTATERT
ncbi:MAG TPA: PRC-barrel domain-containing protein [Jatrophihabitans sp.]|jgi:sporulation protein YlmC with PRC-barrel domain|nr:PRC-barrel domain-containing protein [Jatrophihabitans sp.]